jgi:hypothetical protein
LHGLTGVLLRSPKGVQEPLKPAWLSNLATNSFALGPGFDGIHLDKADQPSTSSTLHPHALPACPPFDAKLMDGLRIGELPCDRNSPVRVLNEVRRGTVQDIAVLHALLARGWNGGN